MNPFEIGKPCIIIAGRELLLKQYIMALKRDKYYIEIQNDDAIKCNQILFDFMQQYSIVWMDYIYMKKSFDRYNHRKSIKEAYCSGSWNNEQKKRIETKIRKAHPSLLQKKAVLWIRQPEQVKQQVTPKIKILNADTPLWSESSSRIGGYWNA